MTLESCMSILSSKPYEFVFPEKTEKTAKTTEKKSGVTVLSGDVYDNRFPVKNIFTKKLVGRNYWITPGEMNDSSM